MSKSLGQSSCASARAESRFTPKKRSIVKHRVLRISPTSKSPRPVAWAQPGDGAFGSPASGAPRELWRKMHSVPWTACHSDGEARRECAAVPNGQWLCSWCSQVWILREGGRYRTHISSHRSARTAGEGQHCRCVGGCKCHGAGRYSWPAAAQCSGRPGLGCHGSMQETPPVGGEPTRAGSTTSPVSRGSTAAVGRSGGVPGPAAPFSRCAQPLELKPRGNCARVPGHDPRASTMRWCAC